MDDRQTERQTGRDRDRQTEIETDRERDRQTDRDIYRQTETETDRQRRSCHRPSWEGQGGAACTFHSPARVLGAPQVQPLLQIRKQPRPEQQLEAKPLR